MNFDENPVKIPDDVPPLIRTLIKLLLDKNPITRPSADKLLNLPELNK
jgi:hypothetical protein